MTEFKAPIPLKVWIGGVALVLFVRAVMAFCLACLFDVLLGSQGHLLDLFAIIIFGGSLLEVTPALWACLRASRAASVRSEHSPPQTVAPDVAEDRTA